MTDSSLLTVVTDTFTAPRWVHHLVKLLTGALVLAVYELLARVAGASGMRAVAVVAVLSLLWFLSLRVRDALDHHTQLIKPDLWCDLALHTAPIAVALLLAHAPSYGVPLLLACVLAYAKTYSEATP